MTNITSRALCVVVILSLLITSCEILGTKQDASVQTTSPRFGLAPGMYNQDLAIALVPAEASTPVFYTLDGSTPTVSTLRYLAPIPVAGNGASVRIKAIAKKPGQWESPLIEGVFTINYSLVSAPQFITAPGTYASDQLIALGCATTGATIKYTTDGSDPFGSASSRIYAAPIALNGPSASLNIQAAATKAGMINSQVTAGAFAVKYQYTLSLASNGGTLTPGATVQATHGVPVAIAAGPAGNGYRFSRWQLSSGQALIADPTASQTTVTLTLGNASLTALYAFVPGTLDPGFGTAGKYQYDGGRFEVYQVIGPTILAGTISDNTVNLNNGARSLQRVSSDLTNLYLPIAKDGSIFSSPSLQLLSDGRYVAGYSTAIMSGWTTTTHFNRTLADGQTPDTSFSPPWQDPDSFLALPDNKLLVCRGGTVCRLNIDGSLDGSFSSGTLSASAKVDRFLYLPASGKVVLCGSFTNYGGTARAGLARINPDGSLDSAFDPGSGINGAISVLAVQVQTGISGELLLIGGSFTAFNGTACTNLVRLLPSGAVDASFDPGAVLTSPVDCLAPIGGGKLLVSFTTGSAGAYSNASSTLVELDGTGAPASGFVPDPATPAMVIRAITVDPDGVRSVVWGHGPAVRVGPVGNYTATRWTYRLFN
jgi:hypothetical protein